jgi:hypothetical protein
VDNLGIEPSRRCLQDSAAHLCVALDTSTTANAHGTASSTVDREVSKENRPPDNPGGGVSETRRLAAHAHGKSRRASGGSEQKSREHEKRIAKESGAGQSYFRPG